MADSEQTYDAIIVGAGIAGSALAAVLARSGLKVLLLEKSEIFTDHVRGEAMLQWGVKEAQTLGLHDALIAAGAHYIVRGAPYDELAPPEAVASAPMDMAQFVLGVRGVMAIGHPHHCQALLDVAERAGAKVR